MAQLTITSLFSEEEEKREGLTIDDLFSGVPTEEQFTREHGQEAPNLLAKGAGALKTLAMDPIPAVQKFGEGLAERVKDTGVPRRPLAMGAKTTLSPEALAEFVKFTTSLSPLDYASLPLMGGTALLKAGSKEVAGLFARALSATDRTAGAGVALAGAENIMQGNLGQGTVEAILGYLGIHTGGKLKRAAAAEEARVAAAAVDPLDTKVRKALGEARTAAEEQKAFNVELHAWQAEDLRPVHKAFTEDPSMGQAEYQRRVNVARGGGGEKATLRQLTDHLTPDEIDTLSFRMTQHPWKKSEDFAPARVQDAITTWRKGEALQPNEIKLFTEVFGDEAGAAAAKGLTGTAFIKDAINLPKAVMASGDASALFRQNVFFTFGRPITSVKALATAAPSLLPTKLGKVLPGQWGEDAYQTLQRNLVEHPARELAEKSKLAVTGLDDVLPREEQFMSGFAEKIPLIGPWVRASGRFHVGFLNKVRMDTFADIGGKFKVRANQLRKRLDEGQLSGDAAAEARKQIEFWEDSDGLAKYINVMTGRGGLGELEFAGAYLNAVAFSPRFASSRLQVTGASDLFFALGKSGNKGFYANLSPPMRKEAMRDISATVVGLSSILAIAQLHDEVEVDLNWRSADFLKGRIGKTRIDIGAGVIQFMRLYAQIGEAGYNMATAAPGERAESLKSPRETLSGREVPESVREKAERFISYKEAPIPRGIARLLSAKDPFPEGVAGFAPLAVQDFVEALNEHGGLLAGGLGAGAALGWGVQTYDAPESPETQARYQEGQQKKAVAGEMREKRRLPDTRTEEQKSIDYLDSADRDVEREELNALIMKLIDQGENALARRLARKAGREGFRPDLEKLAEAVGRQQMEALTEGSQ